MNLRQSVIVSEIAAALEDAPQSYLALRGRVPRQAIDVLNMLKAHPEFFKHVGPEHGPGGRWVLVARPPVVVVQYRDQESGLLVEPPQPLTV